MIPVWLTAIAFCFVAYLTSSRTYLVLALSAIVNCYIDHFTRSDDLYLMVTYSSIEFFTCLGVLYFGDIHKLYQSIILFFMLSLHFVMEAALVYDLVSFIESGFYTYIMMGLIIAQLIGASRGTEQLITLYRSDNHWTPAWLFNLQNHHKHSLPTEKAK